MSDGENGCFGLDNVLMVENNKNPTYLYENLDPIDEGKWLFMPGANIKVFVVRCFVSVCFNRKEC